MDFYLLLGVLGMCTILGGFLLIQMHKVTADSFLYDFLNFTGSILLVIYGLSGRVWPFVILNGIFAAYSLWDLLMKDIPVVKHRKVRRG